VIESIVELVQMRVLTVLRMRKSAHALWFGAVTATVGHRGWSAGRSGGWKGAEAGKLDKSGRTFKGQTGPDRLELERGERKVKDRVGDEKPNAEGGAERRQGTSK
jgi:hypothetical protein